MGLAEHLRENLGASNDWHEVRITPPARHDVLVKVIRNPGARCSPLVNTYIEVHGWLDLRDCFETLLGQRHNLFMFR